MSNQHPVTPPPELVMQWWDRTLLGNFHEFESIATQAARWGSDTELEACATYVAACGKHLLGNSLMCARRPKPPSLKEQALTALHAVATGANDTREQHQDLDTIRRALEALPND